MKPRKTVSETAFENFLIEHKLYFERIEEASAPRPDYLVQVDDLNLFFEIKELAKDDNFRELDDPKSPIIRAHSRVIGDHVRARISDARRQVQFGADLGFPSILLIYNNLDPLSLFGTEDHDFITAMYGEYTLTLDRTTKQIVGEPFQGRNHCLTETRNTSFSAVGRLHPKTGITLFENAFARVAISYERLPAFFNVLRVEIKR